MWFKHALTTQAWDFPNVRELPTLIKHQIVKWQREAIGLEVTGTIDNLVVAQERRRCAQELAQLLEAHE